MDINFVEPHEVPQPRDRVKIERLEARASQDGWRVRLVIDVTPFQERPNLDLQVRTVDGQVISDLVVIETMHRNMEFTVHVRGVSSPVGKYVASAVLYYDERNAPKDTRECPFTIELP